MLSICRNGSVKSWRNRKTCWKNKKAKLFINKCKWEGINFPLEKDYWKTFERNNVAISLNVLYAKKEKIYSAYVSNNNSNRE